MSKIYIGIDAGGTKTAFAACDKDGNVLLIKQTSTIHAKQVSEEEVKNTIFTTVRVILDELGIKIEDIGYIFAGVPGFGEFPEIMEIFDKLFLELLGNNNFKIGNDSVVGWAGSQAGKPGVNIVLGTGAIAYGMDYKGNEARSSGWGPYCGDEGSAYWIGNEAIKLFAKQSDGRIEKSYLYEIIKEKYDLDSDFDFIQKVIDLNGNRTEIAKFSRLLSQAAQMGDASAIEIIKSAAQEAVLAIKAVINKLDFEEDENIYYSYSGGVFNIGSLLTDNIEKDLSNPKLIKVDSVLTPVAGTCLMALRYDEIDLTEELIENLKG